MQPSTPTGSRRLSCTGGRWTTSPKPGTTTPFAPCISRCTKTTRCMHDQPKFSSVFSLLNFVSRVRPWRATGLGGSALGEGHYFGDEGEGQGVKIIGGMSMLVRLGRHQKMMHWMAWWKMCVPKNQGGMGFRDIHYFNLVLLTKQAWRLLHNLDSLCVRVLKAKYFPDGDLMNASFKKGSSFTWQSIMAGVNSLKNGYI
ncbi:hypothetical protein VPH35_140081 [Triticum aestivum]